MINLSMCFRSYICGLGEVVEGRGLFLVLVVVMFVVCSGKDSGARMVMLVWEKD